MVNMDYEWNENDLREEIFFHHIHKFLDHSVEEFFLYLDKENFCRHLFLQKNITYYLICLTLYITKDIHELIENLDKSFLYNMMAKGNCALLKNRILCNLKNIISTFTI